MERLKYQINRIARFIKAAQEGANISIEQSWLAINDFCDPVDNYGFKNLVPGKPTYLFTAREENISLAELLETIEFLLEERDAAWLLTSEGKQHQVSALKTAMHLGATNPAFDSNAAKSTAEKQIRPFEASIKILEQNGYVVSLKA